MKIILAILLNIYPRISTGDVNLFIRIPRNPDNRSLYIEWGCDGKIGSSERTLDRDNEFPTVLKYISHLPSGECYAFATLTREINGKKKQFTSREIFIVQ